MILFAGLAIPDPFIRDIIRISRGLAGARWRPPENLHLTLRYFGQVTLDQAELLDHALASQPFPALDLKLSGIGHFGTKELKSVYVRAEPSPALTALRKHCNRAAREAGIMLKSERFEPHVTLAYLGTRSEPEKVARFEQRLSSFSCGPMLIDHFSLYRSAPKKKGPNLYVPEARYPLLGRSVIKT